jgi:hypothetical protein
MDYDKMSESMHNKRLRLIDFWARRIDHGQTVHREVDSAPQDSIQGRCWDLAVGDEE